MSDMSCIIPCVACIHEKVPGVPFPAKITSGGPCGLLDLVHSTVLAPVQFSSLAYVHYLVTSTEELSLWISV